MHFLITALRVLAAAVAADMPLSEMLRGYRPLPQSRRDLQVVNRQKALAILQKAQPQALASLGEGGRVVVRCSGTENVVRVMAESRRASLAKTAADELAKLVSAK